MAMYIVVVRTKASVNVYAGPYKTYDNALHDADAWNRRVHDNRAWVETLIPHQQAFNEHGEQT